MSVAPMSYVPSFLPKPSEKSGSSKGKPENYWITRHRPSPLPKISDNHSSETELPSSEDLSSSEDDASSQLDVDDNSSVLMPKKTLEFDKACAYLKCSEKPLEECLPGPQRRSMYSSETQKVFESNLSQEKCARRDAEDFRNLQGQYLRGACEVMKCHESAPVKSCYASLSEKQVHNLAGRERDYIASTWHQTCADKDEGVLEEICQKMACKENETLQSCDLRTKRAKTSKDAAFMRRRPRAVCEHAAVKKPSVMRIAATGAVGALLSLGSLVNPRQAHGRKKQPSAASLEESQRLENEETILKSDIRTANTKISDLRNDIQKYKSAHFMSSFKPVKEWETQIAEEEDQSRSWTSRLKEIKKRLQSLNVYQLHPSSLRQASQW